MVKEKLTFTSPKKNTPTKKPQPKQQQIGQPKQPSSPNHTNGSEKPKDVAPIAASEAITAEVEDSNNELINKINKDIRQYRKQVSKHKKLHDEVSLNGTDKD